MIMGVPPVKDFPLPGLHSHMTGSVATPEQGQGLDTIKYMHEMKTELKWKDKQQIVT